MENAWDYEFQWTDEHFTPEQLHPLKYSYDELADGCLERLNKISPPFNPAETKNGTGDKQGESQAEKAQGKPRDLYALLRDHATEDDQLEKLWKEVNTVPDFVDWEQISRGQEVFYRYGGPALNGLAYQSLLGGMGANRVVETLARTGGFSTKVARRRMFETTQHILQCTMSLDSIKPGGEGHASSVRVRLLHAAVRQRILKMAQTRRDYYSVENWGIPINDLDCIATIGTFSATLIWLSFPRQGLWLRDQEIKDYIALWRLIAWYTGTPTDTFETPEKARAMMESLLISEIEPSETSKILANNIIKSLEAQPPGYASRDFLYASARWLNGDALSDRLGLGRPSIYYWLLVVGQNLFFMGICYLYRSVPFLDRRKISTLRRLFYTIIVERQTGLAGKPTLFEFKYVPEYHTLTQMGEPEEEATKRVGVERRNLRALLIATICLGLVTWCGVKVVFGLAGLLI
ncbi:MAG: hypothetical protein M1819_007429 [Sarea resinae]|nr:MAG: hypothetical protein M1819_007429 [Sarea resinae]